MNIRRVVSLTAALAFVGMVLTSVVLYTVPQGRVAYWADWRLMGLTKTQWGAIHINLGLLFLVALGLHIYYNWKPLIQYLKNRARQLKIITPEFNLAAVLVVVFTVGTLAGWPPFATILTVQDDIKAAAARKYGEPPYGHAELSSLKVFARKAGLNLQDALTALTTAGFKVAGPQQTLQEMAAVNGVSSQTLYNAMMIAPTAAAPQLREMPDTPPPGTGNLSLAEFSRQYGPDTDQLRQMLAAQGIEARADMTIKAIAAASQRSPMDIYALLRKAAAAASAG
ncbi:MAG: DUF4405 domain-containing protein [Oceanisphaera sp.]|nr:DUF4405 domain-containing protein [Oceanisphaera sp.]